MHMHSLLANRLSRGRMHGNHTPRYQCTNEQQHKPGKLESWLRGHFCRNHNFCLHKLFHVQSYHSWRCWCHDSGCTRINIGRKWTGILGWTGLEWRRAEVSPLFSNCLPVPAPPNGPGLLFLPSFFHRFRDSQVPNVSEFVPWLI